MNFIPGKLRNAQGVFCDYDGGSVDMARYKFAKPPVNGASVTLGVRPEHIDVGEAAAGSHGARGAVTIVEPMGAETILWTAFAGKSMTIRVDGDSTVRVGDAIGFSFDVARASLFDAASGERL